MSPARGTTNKNARGNSHDRRARKAWIMREWRARELRSFVTPTMMEDGTRGIAYSMLSVPLPGKVRCYACGTILDVESVTIDRVNPGAKGGKYTRCNTRPACATCNSAAGATIRK